MTDEATSPFAAWLALAPGHRFAPMPGTLTPAAQRRQHLACALDPEHGAGRIDPTLLGQDMVLLASRSGLPVDGRVHVAQDIRQHRPLAIDAPYRVRGRIVSLAPAPQGHAVEIEAAAVEAEGRGADAGEPAVTILARYLLPAPRTARPAPRQSAPTASDQAAAAEATLGWLDLTPDRVKSYSADVGNLLHFDPAFAAARGYRAPIAQGLMIVTAGLGRIGGALPGGLPPTFRLTAQFRRPAFWGDRIGFALEGGQWRGATAEGRVAVDGVFQPGPAATGCGADAGRPPA